MTKNTVEGYFGVFKRCIVGVYQHCAYNTFRGIWMNSASFGTTALGWRLRIPSAPYLAIRGTEGKRLTYRACGGLSLRGSLPALSSLSHGSGLASLKLLHLSVLGLRGRAERPSQRFIATFGDLLVTEIIVSRGR